VLIAGAVVACPLVPDVDEQSNVSPGFNHPGVAMIVHLLADITLQQPCLVMEPGMLNAYTCLVEA